MMEKLGISIATKGDLQHDAADDDDDDDDDDNQDDDDSGSTAYTHANVQCLICLQLPLILCLNKNVLSPSQTKGRMLYNLCSD